MFRRGLWNGRDPILKERLFGLAGPEGNHSEDVKEYYYYLDATPTHSYLKYLYKYPQAEYPYARLVEENRRRSRRERNSNWRGPVWFPVNYLIIESLQKFDYFVGPEFQVELPAGSGQRATLWEVAAEISRRLNRIFLRDADGRRPVYGNVEKFQHDPHWQDLIAFYEYFHGDHGAGLGASHQTGWTALVAKMLQQSGE